MIAGTPGWNGLHPMYSAGLYESQADASGVKMGCCLIALSLPTRQPAPANLTEITARGFIRHSEWRGTACSVEHRAERLHGSGLKHLGIPGMDPFSIA